METSFDLRKELRGLFRNHKSEQKRTDIRRRIISAVLAGGTAVCAKKLDELTARLVKEYCQDKATETESELLMHELAIRIHESEMYDAFFVHTLCQDGVDPDAMKYGARAAALRLDWKSLEQLGRNWFRKIFMAYIASSVDRSIQFGLHILGHLHNSTQHLISKLPSDLQFPGQRPKEIGKSSLAAISFMAVSFTCAPSPDLPFKCWLETLIENSGDNRIAEQVFNDVCRVMTINLPNNKVYLRAENAASWAELESQGKFVDTGEFGPLATDPEIATLMLLPKHAEIVRKLGKNYEAVELENKNRGERVLSWLSKNEQTLREYFTACSFKTREAPKRGLRPGGYDHVDVRVSALHNAGLRGVVFHPEGHTFPNAGVEILIRAETPHLNSYRTELALLDKIDTETLANAMHDDLEGLRSLLSAVVHDAFYRIVLGERELREKQPTKRDRLPEGAKYPVRPHLRRLQAGHKASDDAKARGKESLGYALPQGVTFVRAHYSHGQMEYDLPTTPFATYGDEDLFQLSEAP